MHTIRLTLNWLLDHLTPAEQRVLAFLSLGLSTKEIAERCGVSVSTICSHRDSLRELLGLKGEQYTALFELAISHRELLAELLPPDKPASIRPIAKKNQ